MMTQHIMPTSAPLGILSDTHNNESNTLAALNLFRQRNVTQLIHCGDVNRPNMLELFTGFNVWLVWGNNDHTPELRTRAETLGNIHCAGYDLILDINGVPVGACHGDDDGRLAGLARSGLCRWVFCGHSHLHKCENVNAHTRILNPGALGGRHPEPRSIALVHLQTDAFEFFQV